MKLTKEGLAVIEGDNYLSAEIITEGRLDVASAHALLGPLRQHIPVGGVVVDVGASLGDTAAVLAKMVGATGRVYAFEPQHDVYECLSHNTRSMSNIVPVSFGLGDMIEGVAVARDHNNVGASRLERNGGRTGCHVRLMDSLSFDRLDFIKIDAEGWEPLVLDGAVKTINRFRPAMLIEVNDWPLGKMGFDRYSIYSRLDELGYHYQNFDGPYGDVLCLPKEKWVQP